MYSMYWLFYTIYAYTVYIRVYWHILFAISSWRADVWPKRKTDEKEPEHPPAGAVFLINCNTVCKGRVSQDFSDPAFNPVRAPGKYCMVQNTLQLSFDFAMILGFCLKNLSQNKILLMRVSGEYVTAESICTARNHKFKKLGNHC